VSDKTIKYARWVIVLVFAQAVVLNNLWPGGGQCWAYWTSRFLGGGELAIVGLVFIIFPKAMMRLLITNKDEYSSLKAWKLIVSGLIAGVPTFLVGTWFLAIVIREWLTGSANYLNCVK